MNWLVLTKQEQMALLFLTGTLLLGCLVLVVDAGRQEPFEDFHVFRAKTPPPVVPGRESGVEPPPVLREVESGVELPPVLREVESGVFEPPPVSAGHTEGGSDGSPSPPHNTTTKAATVGFIDINTADLEQWQSLPGIGPHTAAAILKHRQQHGRFERIEDLTQVRGIGTRTLKRLQPHLRLSGDLPSSSPR